VRGRLAPRTSEIDTNPVTDAKVAGASDVPRQMAGLSTRTDALYFTLSTMTTIGYGDVHAEGQVARALVCGLIVFNVVVVASLLRAHGRGAV
jgi:hypothetical protein